MYYYSSRVYVLSLVRATLLLTNYNCIYRSIIIIRKQSLKGGDGGLVCMYVAYGKDLY